MLDTVTIFIGFIIQHAYISKHYTAQSHNRARMHTGAVKADIDR